MIRTRTVLCLALLASTAACGGGGGGGGGSPPPATGAGSTTTQGSGSSTGFSNPSVVASSGASGLGDANMANDQTSQTATLVQGDGTAANPSTITIHVASPGIDHTFTTTGNVQGLQDATFNGVPISNLGDTATDTLFTNLGIVKDGNDVLVLDNSGSLSASNYGIWSHTDANGNVTVGAFSTGTPTSAADMATLSASGATATYAGSAVGTGSTAGQNFNVVGTSNWTANFGSREVDWTASLSTIAADGSVAKGPVLSGTGSFTSGTPKFAGMVTSSGTSELVPTQLSGSMAGSVYGGGAQEIGNVFSVAGGQTKIIGAAGGVKQ